MSTRAARYRDHWRKLPIRNYSIQLKSLAYSGLKVLHDDKLILSSGITAIAGGNGVGKSTLAHAAVETLAGLDGEPALRERSARISGCSLLATVVDATGSENQCVLTLNGADRTRSDTSFKPRYAWLDPSNMSMLSQRQVLLDPQFRDILEGLAPRDLSPEELASASFLVGKDYTSCNIWEIQEYGPFPTWPYFEVTCGGVTYGSESMGQGELSLLISLWTIRTAARDSILVIEEPETHLSARSQSALMDALASACISKGLWILITTHSSVVLNKLPREHIRLLVSEGGKSRLIANPKLHDLASIVGGGASYKCLLLVEDECAKHFVRSILENLDLDLGRQCAFGITDGEARISSILTNLPHARGWSNIIGCFDGDLRGAVDTAKFRWPFVHLPGNVAPEQLLRASLAPSSPGILADELRVNKDAVSIALAAVSGSDLHDWLTALAENLGRNNEELVRAMVRIWLETNREAAACFVSELRNCFS